MSKLVYPVLPLQKVDLEIHRAKEERDEKPRQLAVYREKQEHASRNLQAIHEEIKQLKLEGSRLELEVKEMDAKIEKLNIQSNQAKKNDEFHALLKETSGVKADRSRLEDGLLDIYMQVDEKVKLEKIRKEEEETSEKDFSEAKKRTDDEIGALNQLLEELLDKRRARTEGVDAEVLKRYERVLGVKDDGNAIAVVEAQEFFSDQGKEHQFTCTGCNVDVNAQEVNLIMLGRDIVCCRFCSRILYLKAPEE